MAARTYLPADDRRRQLLDAASRLFVREGFSGMTMVAVAGEAGVSRRLVYDHFPDLASLYEAFFDDRASRYLAAIDAALVAAGEGPGAFADAYGELLAMPPEDQRAVRLLLADPGLPDLQPLRDRVRSHIEQRWMRRIPTADGPEARALLWMVVSGVFAVAELVTREELTREAAIAITTAVIASLPPMPSGGDLTPTPTRRSTDGDLAHP